MCSEKQVEFVFHANEKRVTLMINFKCRSSESVISSQSDVLYILIFQ